MAARPDLAARNRARANPNARTRNPLYVIWRTMIARCTNPNATDFERYGARGIYVCARWTVFENFVADMAPRPAGMTLERNDGERGYEPGNCRWATPVEQARNRRNNTLVTYQGKTAPVAEWAERVGLEKATLAHRIRAGWDTARALTTPSLTNRKANHV